MKTINELNIVKKNNPLKVIQFGEGNFLRAFIDWQIQQMNNQDLFNGSVAIVQPLDKGLVDMLEAQDNNYTVVLEGLLNGEKVQTHEILDLVSQTVNPYADNDKYMALADVETAEFIISNTTEAGIAFNPEDKLSDAPASAFPGKLTQLMYRRFKNGFGGYQILPCELIEHNGDVLKEMVLKYADLWELGDEFIAWVNDKNDFYSTLVDRIVPGFPWGNKEEVFDFVGYEDNLLVKAEAFMLLVIEGNPKIADLLPMKAAGLNVIVTDNMQPYRERKVRLLNGPHTAMTPVALLAGVETVGDVMNDVDFAQYTNDLMYQEISPMIDLPADELATYAEAIKERFSNPFVRHELTSIALNSISKFKSRLLPTVIQTIERTGTVPPRITLALAAWLTIYGPEATPIQPQDTEDILAEFEQLKQADDYVVAALSDEKLWGQDLTQYPALVELVKADMALIAQEGTRKVVQSLNN
jgi:tagaturonate reductase